VPVHRHLPPLLLRRGLDGLERTLDALHARRFVHLDLHQKLNALIDAQGHAWLIDLGQGLDCSSGLLRRLVFPALARVDRNAVLKFRARYAPDTLEPSRRDQVVARFGVRRDRWPKRIARVLRRMVAGDR
jgi:O-methyltransferase involved in polyketide biosynthesis